MVLSRKHTGHKVEIDSRASITTGKAKKTSKKNAVLKEQIQSLGGTAEDYELVRDADEDMDSGSIATALTNEVSKFLEGLNFNLPELPQERPDPKSSKKLPPSKAEVPSIVEPSSIPKIKKPGKERTRKDTPSKTPSKAPAIDAKSQTELANKVVFNPASRFIVPPASQWYNAVSRLNVETALPTITPAQLNSFHTRAAELHTEDMKTFTSSSSGSSSASEASFLSKIIQSGTLSDRLSALTLLVQSSPVHNLKALETLKGMSERGKGQGGREESLKALRCVVDWWVGGGAPERKLKYFRDQPLLHPGVTDQHLVLWYFEDWLKKYFFSILQILENLSLDPLPYVRTQTLNLIFILLRDKPEQEQNLLRLLVNKLGDTDKSLCSRASYHILQLLQPHAPMKGVVVREITALVLRPAAPTAAATMLAAAAFAATTSQLHANIASRKIRFAEDDTPAPTASSATAKSKGKVATTEKKQVNVHARYYATITFNQIVLTPADRDVALKLIDVYFEMFKELLGEGKISEEGGVVEDGDEIAEVKTDKDGRVFNDKQSKGKGKGKIKEIKGAAGFGEIEDENSKLISAILTGVNRALPFAKIDAKDVGLLKHIDTLFLITHKSTFNISLQALLLIQHIAASLTSGPSSSASISKSIVDRYHRTLYASLHDERLASSSKQAMYLNLLFKSIKTDAGNLENERIKALIKRFVQVLVSGGNGATEFIAGGLYLLGELFSTIPGLRSMVTEVAKQEEEPYDSRKRDPQYAHASSSPLWELTPLLHHYHPAISLHARQLLSSQPLTASADLSLNTLSHFLDRFVYKNAKKISPDATKGKGVSAMQPSASGIEGVKLIKGELTTSGDLLMNEEKFLKRRPEDVPVDQLFFHKYFTRKNERVREKHTKSSNEDSEVDSDADSDGGGEMDLTGDEAEIARDKEASDEEEEEGSELDEEEVWKAMQASMPKVLADDDDLMNDSDVDPDGDDSDERSSLNDEDLQDEDVEEDSDNELSLVEGSDNEDLISLNDDGLIEYDGSDAEVGDAEEWDGIGIDSAKSNKRKRNDEEKKRRKKLKSLPTFASYEDYAKMIEDGPEDDI
ncbi:CBF/Mak21 family-domain-containing protein [Lentinula edodes]|uniref:CBF/Mak21 family-domain-containing protein n=1 Tax=Lentinula edodes TaxID=5353 RepID=UPI001E8D60ED|nr:CBF/Mak21 family-domain-containing protein [Lentinula edodes]KAH7869910.1 CBF/Mak21 family-domain-containing protein [Lentinula edodes]